MSPRGIAGPSDKSSPDSVNKCRLARAATLPNFVALRQEVCEISAVENFVFEFNEGRAIESIYVVRPLSKNSIQMTCKFICI